MVNVADMSDKSSQNATPAHRGKGRMKSVDKAAVAASAGARVRQLRAARGLTRDTFGQAVGIEPRALGNYEDGLRVLPPELAIRIATYFGVTLDWIYWGRVEGMPFAVVQELKLISH